ncbi:MAG TPA: glycosyltransferase family 4 protein, partial [Acidobacteriota bacterium]|nr:glycosyltransferase family 4 protein [Acidobacteriota bacterium]
MKIAIVYDMIYPFHIGGAEYRNFRVAKLLAKSGHDIHLVGVKLWDGPDTIRRNGITLHGICRYKDLYGFGGNRSIIEIYKFARACYSFFKKNEFDVIDSASFCFLHNFALKAVLPKKTKYIMTWHQYFGSYWFSYTNPIIAACAYILENLNLKLTSTHTCVSTTTQKQLKKKGVLAKHIPNGIEVQEIKKY